MPIDQRFIFLDDLIIERKNPADHLHKAPVLQALQTCRPMAFW
jgi:hypothetical protein